MNKINTAIAILLTLLLLNACGTIAEGLGGSKKKGSDEFLVEKKAPLVLPRDFGELPEPGVKMNKNLELIKENSSSVEEMINQSSSTGSNIENNKSSSSTEKFIMKEINKRKINEENLDEDIEEVTKIPKNKSFYQKLKEKFN
tara:strand:+ start:52 stop:480 length:429 start_codon:yes stop_codon:yes gene_type:complete